MNRSFLSFFLGVMVAAVTAILTTTSVAHSRCPDAWSLAIEKQVPTGDGQGHGPDIGSDEWQSVLEFKLGVRGTPQVPDRNSDDWCLYIERLANGQSLASGSMGNQPETSGDQSGPSFACDKAPPESIEAIICADQELSGLDRKLSKVYAAASQKAADEHPPRLKAEQRGWIKGRNDCWKSDDQNKCVRDAYVQRIAELQALYRLVPTNGPVLFTCNDNPANEVAVTFCQTDPPTLVAEYGDGVSLMFAQPSGSGTRYAGRNETFWEHHGEALIQWGYGVAEMRCIRKP